MAEIKVGTATFTDEDVSALGTVRSLLGSFSRTTEGALGVDESYPAYSSICRIHDAVKERFVGALEAEELEALGGTEAAERGWNALRKRNPNHDASTGVRPIESFGDLPHKLKVTYAVFAQGVLDAETEGSEELAEWEKELLAAAEPHQFKVGDRATITGPRRWVDGSVTTSVLEIAKTVTVVREADSEGDVDVRDENGVSAFIDPASLTPIAEPRTWERAAYVPDGVWFTSHGPDGGCWRRSTEAGGYDFRYSNGKIANFSSWVDGNTLVMGVDRYAPFVEVIA